MRLKFFIPILLLIVEKSNSQAFIEGTIVDSLNNDVLIYEPINGCFNYEIPDTIFFTNPSPLKFFFRKVDIKEPMQLVIVVRPLVCVLTVFPNDTTKVVLNVNAWDTTNSIQSVKNAITFEGKNKHGNEALNLYNFPGMGMLIDFHDDLEKVDFFGKIKKIALFDSILQRQTLRYKKLLDEEKITLSFYSFVKQVVNQFLLSNFISNIRLYAKYNFEKKIDNIRNMYKYYKLPDDSPILYNNRYYNSIAYEKYYFPKMLKDGTIEPTHDEIITVGDKQLFLNANLAAWQEAPKPLQESLWALNLLSLKKLFAGSFGQADVKTYLAFFPNSPFKKFFVPPYYGRPAWTQEDSLKVTFINPAITDNLDSILAKNFKNDNVLIDLWATWCTPCKEEFRYTEEIDQFCFKNNIQKLYISIDKMKQKERMIKDIYAYQLTGSHIMMTYKLQNDIIKKIYSDNENDLTIPRYILANAKGQIINLNRLRPSYGNLFYDTILKELNH